MSCCPEPQVVVTETCNTYNTDVEAADAQQIFEHANGAASGYVTFQNFNASGGEANVSTDQRVLKLLLLPTLTTVIQYLFPN